MSKKIDLEELKQNIQGWIMRVELKYFHEIAKDKKKILEIGSWKGLSTIAFASGLPEDGIIYCIDPFTGTPRNHKKQFVFAEFINNLKKYGVENKVNIAVAKSEEYIDKWKEKNIFVDLLFIDGAHHLRGIALDFLNYIDYLKVGGILIVHDHSDINNHPSVQAFMNLAEKAYQLEIIEKKYGCSRVYKKTKEILWNY